MTPRKAGKRGKYRNIPTLVDGIKFASKKEAARYRQLKLLESAGEIRHLRCQVPYSLAINGVKIGKYVADFGYVENCIEQDSSDRAVIGREVIEDVKGFKTAVYRLKKKLMKALHGIDVRET